MAKRSITKRWLVNSLGVIGVILLIGVISFSIAIQNYYYSSAKQYVNSKMNMITSLLNRYVQDTNTNFSAEMKNLVESFSEKDKMELMVINSKGRVTITSSGFTPPSNTVMEDYSLAQKSANNQGFYVGFFYTRK